MLSIFVWTLDDVLWLIGVGILALIGIGLLIACVAGKLGNWLLNKRWNDDDEDEQD